MEINRLNPDAFTCLFGTVHKFIKEPKPSHTQAPPGYNKK